MISIVFLLKKKKKMRKKKNYNPFTIKIVLAKQTCNVKQSIKERKKKFPARKAKNINLIFFFIEEKWRKANLVPTFSGDSHFSPYILFLPLLVPILKNASCFGPCCYSFNRNILRDKRCNSKC